jgi:hypothetical protein
MHLWESDDDSRCGKKTKMEVDSVANKVAKGNASRLVPQYKEC